MLDAYIIFKIKELEKDKQEQEANQPCLYIELEEPLPYNKPPTEPERKEPIVFDL